MLSMIQYSREPWTAAIRTILPILASHLFLGGVVRCGAVFIPPRRSTAIARTCLCNGFLLAMIRIRIRTGTGTCKLVSNRSRACRAVPSISGIQLRGDVHKRTTTSDTLPFFSLLRWWCKSSENALRRSNSTPQQGRGAIFSFLSLFFFLSCIALHW